MVAIATLSYSPFISNCIKVGKTVLKLESIEEYDEKKEIETHVDISSEKEKKENVEYPKSFQILFFKS